MTTIIGTDEALKGDTFGGIVVAGVKADDQAREQLEKLNVKDSKKTSALKKKILADRIRKVAKVYFVNFYPEQYNEEISKFGLTTVLNNLHKKCIKTLSTENEKVVVDKYPGCDIEGECITKAESQYIEVAAASVIASAEAAKQMETLSNKAGFQLPLGSTHVLDALTKMRDKNLDFTKFAKTSFRNVKEIMHTQPDVYK